MSVANRALCEGRRSLPIRAVVAAGKVIAVAVVEYRREAGVWGRKRFRVRARAGREQRLGGAPASRAGGGSAS